MANKEISQLTNGNPAQAADIIPIDRAGANFSITAQSIAALGSAAGSLSGSVTTFSTNASPQTLDVSSEGLLDWLIPSSGGGGLLISKSLAASNLAGQLAKSYTTLGGVNGLAGSNSTTVHSDVGDTAGLAYVATNNTVALTQADITNFNYGFVLSAPASTTTVHNLNLYICLWGGPVGQSRTAKVVASLSDSSAADVTLTQVDNGTNANVSIYKANFQFKCGIAGSVLRIQAFVTAGTSTSNTFGLMAATLF